MTGQTTSWPEEQVALVFIEELGKVVHDFQSAVLAVPNLPAGIASAIEDQQAYLVKMKTALNLVLPEKTRAQIKADIVALIQAG